ncbi:MAG: cupin domain-containing protein [Candidatus Bathyarchaeia archaeon]
MVGSAFDLDTLVEFAQDGIVSKTLVNKPHGKIVLFCMASGQTLSEHTASVPATIHILHGKGEIKLGGQQYPAKPNAVFHMPAKLRHAVRSDENLVFLLTMFHVRKFK